MAKLLTLREMELLRQWWADCEELGYYTPEQFKEMVKVRLSFKIDDDDLEEVCEQASGQ